MKPFAFIYLFFSLFLADACSQPVPETDTNETTNTQSKTFTAKSGEQGVDGQTTTNTQSKKFTAKGGEQEAGKGTPTNQTENTNTSKQTQSLTMGAARFNQYLPLLQGKRVGMVVNQTSALGNQHLVDILLAKGVNIKSVFAPEHGFRGKADAGEKVSDGKDSKTGLPIVSLYGKNKKPSATQLANLDVVVFDIQDVGARFYTYISTMHYVMEACAEQGKKVIVLDRPNPNGFYVDGPVLDPKFRSFVGMHEIPIVHGMTVAELAQMINGEQWLKGGVKCDLTVVTCEGYTHNTFYELPIKPSPNLPNAHSIYLYPSLCFFEGTPLSVGRGTTTQFQIVGHPALKGFDYNFKPISREGAKYPKHENKTCYGLDLSNVSLTSFQNNGRLNLQWLLQMYQQYPDKANFFNKNNFIDKLAGTDKLKQQVKQGMTESQIRQTWEPQLTNFKQKRQKYLLYADF